MDFEPNQREWTTRLRSSSSEREAAIAELTGILVRGLKASLSDHFSGGLQAEDIAQEAILRILNSLDSFQGRSKFTTWAMTIAMRVGISELRRKHYQDVSLDVSLEDGSALEIPVSAPAPADNEGRASLLSTLRDMIETELSQKQRSAMQALLGGMAVEEIARRTDSNRNAVYKLVHDARLKLRNAFEARGITVDDVAAVFA